MSLGERLKTLRKTNKMTQLDLANRLGKDNTTISKWESDIYQPDTDELRKLAEIFSITTDFLVGRTEIKESRATYGGEEEEYDYKKDPDISPELMNLLDKLAAIPDKRRAEIIKEATEYVDYLKAKGKI